MRINISQLRRIIKEEITKVVLHEGTLDVALVPKDNRFVGADDARARWITEIRDKLTQKLKEAIIPELGKEMGSCLHIEPTRCGYGDGSEGYRKALAIFFDEDDLFRQVNQYVRSGRSGSSELMDELVRNYKPAELKEALPDLYKNIAEHFITKAFDELGFTKDRHGLGLDAVFDVDGSKFRISAHPSVFDHEIRIEIALNGR